MSDLRVSPTEVVVFDIDDTLYLERDYVRSGFRAVGMWAHRVLGVGDLADWAWKAFEGGVRGTVFDIALANCGCEANPDVIAQLVACYRDHVPDIKLLDDARVCLDGLSREAGMTVAVVTDGPLASQEAKARSLGLAAWSEHVVFTDALGAGYAKPNSGAFELLEQRLSVAGRQCAYVADNPAKDFVGPHKLGWKTIRVRRKNGLHFGVESGGDVDHEVVDLSNLFDLLEGR